MKLSQLMMRPRVLQTHTGTGQARRQARAGRVGASSAGGQASEPRFGYDAEDSFEITSPASSGTTRVAPSEPALLPLSDVTVLFADVVQSMQLYGALGDRRAATLIVGLMERARRTVDAHRGELVKTMGDGLMVTYHDPAIAVRSAVELHREAAAHAAELGRLGLRLRIGIHRGPVLAHRVGDEVDYHGQTVNIASRLQSAGKPNEILVSEAVLSAPGVLDELAAWLIVPEVVSLRGLNEPVRTYRLGRGRFGGNP